MWSLVEELDGQLEREGSELDSELARSRGTLETDDGDEIPFSAKGGDGRIGQATPGAQTKQNSAERTGNVGEIAGNDRPEFELETHSKNDLLKRSTIDDQGSRKAKGSSRSEELSRRGIGRCYVDW